MILYNLTIKIDLSIEREWLTWMDGEFIPLLMDASPFTEYKFCKLLKLEEVDGQTFALQLFCQNIEQLEAFQAQLERTFQVKLLQKFPNKLVFFPTAMEILS